MSRRLAFAAACIIAAGAGTVTYLQTATSPDKPPVVLVVAAAAAPVAVEVQTRDLYKTLRLEGTVETFDPVPVPAGTAGRFQFAAGIKDGTRVTVGQPLGTLRSCVPIQGRVTSPSVNTSPDSAAQQSCPDSSMRATTVRAPAAGVLSDSDVQDVIKGMAVGSVQPDGFHVRLPIVDKSALYGFVDPPKDAKAQLLGGPSGFAVAFERVAYDKDSGAVEAFVTLPATVAAFPGLRAVVVFVTGKTASVPTLPLSAVRGREGEGDVVIVDSRGDMPKHVTLGGSDDQYVQVEGLEPGTKVLLFPLESDFRA